MRTSKKGFMVFIGLLVLLFLSILCVSRSYNKSLKVKKNLIVVSQIFSFYLVFESEDFLPSV